MVLLVEPLEYFVCLLQHDASSSLNSFFENAWHGAEAYHFWLLAHRELYASHFDQAMKVFIFIFKQLYIQN